MHKEKKKKTSKKKIRMKGGTSETFIYSTSSSFKILSRKTEKERQQATKTIWLNTGKQ